MKENLTLELCKKYLKDKRLWDLPWDEIESELKRELYREAILDTLAVTGVEKEMAYSLIGLREWDSEGQAPYCAPSEKDQALLDELYRLPCIQVEIALSIIWGVKDWYKWEDEYCRRFGRNMDVGCLIEKSWCACRVLTHRGSRKFWDKLSNDKRIRIDKLGDNLFTTVAPILIDWLRDFSSRKEEYIQEQADEANSLYERLVKPK